ncbi:MAG: lytic transglycosylase domain-containing protein [Clostridia bacterium]|nr:lytic transglycosylase domain-containing protein [Clostridia bacterium]MBR0356294.1 lytic transglycosylase domain-containing protein [Clostridia bacterium]
MSSWKLWVDDHKLISALLALLLLAALLGGYFLYVRPALLRSKYKLSYESDILSSAKEFDLDPYLVCGVIFTESAFRPEAKSNVGALGLMQLMPATGLEEAELLAIEGVTQERLTEPSLNIRLGCNYLRKLLDEFKTESVALAAYNAGPGRVRQWLKEYGTKEDGSILYIPYPETSKYVGRVESARGVYERLYPELAAKNGEK